MSDQKQKNPCYCRNGLVHLTVFPSGESASYALHDPQTGEVYAIVPVRDPIRGSDLSKMIPDGLHVEFADCVVFNLSGKLLIGTAIEFDTCVVTERAEITIEERLQRMELRDQRRQALERKRQEEFERWKREQAEMQVDPTETEEAPVIEPETAPEAQPEPEEETDA